MANRHEGEIAIRLDRTRTLRFDLNAFAEFETALGETVHETFAKVDAATGEQKPPGFREVRALLWAALLHEDEKLTLSDAGRLAMFFEADGVGERLTGIMELVGEALEESLGSKQKKTIKALKERARAATKEPSSEAPSGGGTPSASPTESSDSSLASSGA